ncbi:MAG: M1 family metallopeptidase, partial [Pseudolabrys sp.]
MTNHTVAGTGTIRWLNTSRRAATELYLHLYLNAFKNNRTRFLRSPFGVGRNAGRPRDWGYIDVKYLRARELGGVDLWPAASAHSPGDPDDQTDIRVPLPAPIAPGQLLTLDVQFESKLPEIVERTGYSNNFYLVGQWYPKLARRRPDGSWAHFSFDARSEFFADFGAYSVTLDVPEWMGVAATGTRVAERVERGRRIVRHEMRPVHDFAWAAWDRFEERRERVGAVEVRILYPPGYAHNAELSLQSVRFALPLYSQLYGAYPYPVLTIVSPPEDAAAAGGMEYPTLITTGGPWYLGYLGRGVEAVTVHELAHQWFYGLVATDEQAWPFLD